MSYVTVVLPFNATGDVAGRLLSTAWLFRIATHRVLSLAKSTPTLPGSDIGWKSVFRREAYSVIPNRRYADGVVALVRGIYESCRALGVSFRDAELGDWLMFQQSEREYPARNITLKAGYEFHVTVVGYDGSTGRVTVEPTVPKNYRVLLDGVLREKPKYCARVMVKGFGERKSDLWLNGEIHLTLPLELYHRCMAKDTPVTGSNVAGVDVNVDRLNVAIVDTSGRLRDTTTFWFREVTSRGYPRRRARCVIGMSVHRMLKYLASHGVGMVVLENPEVIGYLRYCWVRSGERGSRNYNYKVAVFRSSIIEMIALKATLYGLKSVYVDPRGTSSSQEHRFVMEKHGLDRHTASAYLIALKHLQDEKTMNNRKAHEQHK
ncbi:MAG: hypothetical protein QXJ97_06530 [Desulfurococcaceae archaeon]